MGGACASGNNSGAGVGVFEDLDGCIGATGGLGALGAMDSRRGLDEAAVTVDVACTGDGSATGATGDSSGAAGDVPRGVRSGLGSSDAILLTFGVLGPAGASGTCTEFPLAFPSAPLVGRFVGSGSGTEVCVAGEAAIEAGVSRGVDTVDAGGDAAAFSTGAMSCSRGRLASGGLDELSCVATDPSLVLPVVPSAVGNGEVSRLRLFDGRVVGFLFWVAGVDTLCELKLNSFSPFAASLIFSEAPMSS